MNGLALPSHRVAAPAPLSSPIDNHLGDVPLGLLARRLEARALRRLPWPDRLRRILGIRLLDALRIAWYAPRLAPQVRAQTGISVARQFAVLLRLAFGKGIDPSIYYLEELYKPGALDAVDQYFLRREVKGKLLRHLHRLQPPAAERRINLGDKLQFLAWCARTSLPHAAPLMLIEDGRVVWQSGNLLDLDQDLFAKPRVGRGARGVQLYRRISAFRYEAEDGRHLTLGQIVSDLIRRFDVGNVMVLPRLHNHPELEGLAGRSLITIRAVTCLDERQQPELVLAYLRVLTKLEPDWPVKKPIAEYASVIDLEDGRLSAITGDQPECLSDWYDRHPVTGVAVKGRVVPCWPAVAALAERAHRVTRDRILVGWDIAITPSGPLLLEGNSYPDVHYPQRIYRQPYGEMRIGALLRHHMERLERKWAEEKRSA
ncbi:sugar-transfer associated ATP-grasp domain-containing protein [Dongia sp.]|uniref:sugar-transfer associated ATP-grasp domain-containing protein n=1 Tax=Dongia sp. TaxID=1977262 RepID=UPI003753E3EA